LQSTINIVFDRVGKLDPVTRGIEIAVNWLGIQFDVSLKLSCFVALPHNAFSIHNNYKSYHLFFKVMFWSQHISFWLVGIIIVTSIRGLLITLTKVCNPLPQFTSLFTLHNLQFFYAIASSKSSNIIVLCLAQLMVSSFSL
jgi:hypothetical protein